MPCGPFVAVIETPAAVDEAGVVATGAVGAAELVFEVVLLPPHAATSSANPRIAAAELTRHRIISSSKVSGCDRPLGRHQ
jgi:hypothetical protein